MQQLHGSGAACHPCSPAPHQLQSDLLVLECDGDAQQEDGTYSSQHGLPRLQVREANRQLGAALLHGASGKGVSGLLLLWQ
jgi:hypothetical protein